MKNRTTVERKSERELVVTRTFNGPARIVFEAWTKPELFRRWWVPKSMGMSLRSCEMDVRVGGRYRLEFEPDAMAFFGTDPRSDTALAPRCGPTRKVVRVALTHDGYIRGKAWQDAAGHVRLLYSSKEALDAAGTGAADAMVETFAQLDELLLTLGGAWDGHEVVDLAVGRSVLHYAEENPEGTSQSACALVRQSIALRGLDASGPRRLALSRTFARDRLHGVAM